MATDDQVEQQSINPVVDKAARIASAGALLIVPHMAITPPNIQAEALRALRTQDKSELVDVTEQEAQSTPVFTNVEGVSYPITERNEIIDQSVERGLEIYEENFAVRGLDVDLSQVTVLVPGSLQVEEGREPIATAQAPVEPGKPLPVIVVGPELTLFVPGEPIMPSNPDDLPAESFLGYLPNTDALWRAIGVYGENNQLLEGLAQVPDGINFNLTVDNQIHVYDAEGHEIADGYADPNTGFVLYLPNENYRFDLTQNSWIEVAMASNALIEARSADQVAVMEAAMNEEQRALYTEITSLYSMSMEQFYDMSQNQGIDVVGWNTRFRAFEGIKDGERIYFFPEMGYTGRIDVDALNSDIVDEAVKEGIRNSIVEEDLKIGWGRYTGSINSTDGTSVNFFTSLEFSPEIYPCVTPGLEDYQGVLDSFFAAYYTLRPVLPGGTINVVVANIPVYGVLSDRTADQDIAEAERRARILRFQIVGAGGIAVKNMQFGNTFVETISINPDDPAGGLNTVMVSVLNAGLGGTGLNEFLGSSFDADNMRQLSMQDQNGNYILQPIYDAMSERGVRPLSICSTETHQVIQN